MIKFFCLLLTCLSFAARADCPSSPPPPTPTWEQWTFSDEPAIGSITMPTFRKNAAGYLAYWYGPANASGLRPLSFVYVTTEVATPTYLASLAFDIATSGVTAAFKSRRTLPLLSDPQSQAIWCPFWPEMLAGTGYVAPPPPPPPPPPIVYAVAVNGKVATRPAYKVMGGVLGTKEVARATVGVTCACAVLEVMKGTTRYCYFAGAPATDVVAVCLPR